MKKIGPEFSGLQWDDAERADAMGSPRVFSLGPPQLEVQNDVAPMISSVLEDAAFWADTSAIESNDGREQYEGLQSEIENIESWLETATTDSRSDLVDGMLAEVRAVIELKNYVLSKTQ